MLKPIVVIGAGGYAQEVAWVIDDLNAVHPEWDLLGFVDPLLTGRNEHAGRPVMAGYHAVSNQCVQPYFACGIGTPAVRKKEVLVAESLGWKAASLLHPSVIRASSVSLAGGTIVGPGAVLAPYARIGRHCAINVQTTVGHDSVIGDFSVISPGARILGRAVLEEEAFIGANATIYPGCRVGAGATLGANSFLHTHLAAGQSALGIPARAFLPVKKQPT